MAIRGPFRDAGKPRPQDPLAAGARPVVCRGRRACRYDVQYAEGTAASQGTAEGLKPSLLAAPLEQLSSRPAGDPPCVGALNNARGGVFIATRVNTHHCVMRRLLGAAARLEHDHRENFFLVGV